MTFGDMMQDLLDRFGITGQVSLIERMVNQAKDDYVTVRKWPHLESSVTQLWTTSARNYTLNSGFSAIVGLEDSDGEPLDGDVGRATYDNLYRADDSTGTAPTVYVEEGSNVSSDVRFHLWPTLTTNSSGLVHGLVRVADLSNATSTQSFQHIPSNHIAVINIRAAALFREWEGDAAAAQILDQQYRNKIAVLAGEIQQEKIDDGT